MIKSLGRRADLRAVLAEFFAGCGPGIRGAAAIELAALAPVLVMAIVVTADLGMGIYRRMQVQGAAQAGAEYAVTHGFDASAIASAIAISTPLTGLSASPAPRQFCGCASSTGIVEVACDANCAGGAMAGSYVTASAQSVYQTILPYPLLPESFTFTAQSTVRLQ
jgi:Flp pilus assembly protein TadG